MSDYVCMPLYLMLASALNEYMHYIFHSITHVENSQEDY